jgi:hypothetical protein
MPMPPPMGVWLGKTTPLASAAASTPTLVFGPGYRYLLVYHYIAGYSGSAIATIRLGTGTTVDTGANYSSMTAHFVAGGTTVGTSTSRVSQTGMQVANDAVNTGRRGQHIIWNPEGDPKFMETVTNTYSSTSPAAAATAHSTISICGGNWWNNAQAQCINMEGAGTNLNAGSYIDVYGLPV